MPSIAIRQQRIPVMDPAVLEQRTRPANISGPVMGRRVTIAAGMGAFAGSIMATLIVGLLV